tara:strand:+ start:664 stop:1083 length:420 start_codon:yes stop_codon:yes gene_type:complete
MGVLGQRGKFNKSWPSGIILSGLALIVFFTWGTPDSHTMAFREPCEQQLFAKSVQHNGQYCAKVKQCDGTNSCVAMAHVFACSKKNRQFIVAHNSNEPGCFDLMAQEENGKSAGPIVRFCNLCEQPQSKTESISDARQE